MKSNTSKLLFILIALSFISLSCSMLDVTGSDNGIEKEYRVNRYSVDLTDDAGKLSKAKIVVNFDFF